MFITNCVNMLRKVTANVRISNLNTIRKKKRKIHAWKKGRQKKGRRNGLGYVTIKTTVVCVISVIRVNPRLAGNGEAKKGPASRAIRCSPSSGKYASSRQKQPNLRYNPFFTGSRQRDCSHERRFKGSTSGSRIDPARSCRLFEVRRATDSLGFALSRAEAGSRD